MTSNAIPALQQAVERIRAQIPSGGLSRVSVEELLHAAEAVIADTNTILQSTTQQRKTQHRQAKRLIVRQRWAEIARENAE